MKVKNEAPVKQLIVFRAESQREACQKIIRHLPVDGSMQVTISPYVKPGSAAQRRTYWGVRMGEVADQAWWDGRQYPAPVWHQFFKERFLPDAPEEGITLPGYCKWMEMPGGELRMMGSTERLTMRGRYEYQMRVEAFCAGEFGVRFSEIKSVGSM